MQSIHEKLRRLGKREWRNYYRWLYRMKHTPRRKPGAVSIGARPVVYGDWAAFLGAYADIFCSELYRFRPEGDRPTILDVGANIGLATLWWKLHYPAARVLAVEADPKIYSMLETNVRTFGFADVQLLNAAAWTGSGVLKFSPDDSDGGRVSSEGIEVNAVSLAELIERFDTVDFLKLDIEGGERTVLPAIEGSLRRVRTMFCEYHSSVGEPQRLDEVLHVINRAGFRYHIKNLLASESPFLALTESCGFDNQLNIFCIRP